MRFVWLTVAALLSYLAAGDQPIAIAGWLAPVFLLRFFRVSPRAWLGYLWAILGIGATLFLGFHRMSPTPPVVFAVSVLIGSALGLLPYLLDRWLYRSLSPFPGTLLFPAVVVSLEWLNSLGASGNSGSLAYLSDYASGLSQLAAITGIWGLVFLAHWLAAVINLAWEQGPASLAARKPLIAWVALFAVVLAYGAARLALAPAAAESIRAAGVTVTPDERARSIEAVQGFFEGRALTEDEEVALRQVTREVAEGLFHRSQQQVAAGARLVVWSEAALIAVAEDEQAIFDRASELAREHGIYLGITPAFTDGDYAEKLGTGAPFVSNELVMFAPGGQTLWRYSKTKLVPGLENHIHPGNGVLPVTQTPVGGLSGAICFDLDHPSLIRSAGREGIRMLVAPSNDWKEIRYLHARIARVRAIENGFALLRPTSNGLSIATDAYGREVGAVDFFETDGGSLFVKLPVHRVSTIYSWIGDLLAHACVAGSLALVAASLIQRRREKIQRLP